MKEITNDFLKEVTEDYLSKDIYTIARGALSNSDVTKLVENKGEYNKTRPMFSIEIQTLPVCNQKKSGRCWIFAGLNVLREIIGKKYNLEKFELSQSYIAFWDKLEKCNFLLETVMSLLEVDKDDRTLVHVLSNGIEDGGQWDMFVNIVNKYGVVPQDAFPETYQSSNSRDINRV
jgi:bleomycin hydrolase